MMNDLLHVSNLSFKNDLSDECSEITLRVENHSVLCLLGPDSDLLLKCLTFTKKCKFEQAYLFGKTYHSELILTPGEFYKKKMNLAFKEKSLISNLNLIDNITLPLRYHKKPVKVKQIESDLKRFGVDEKYFDKRPHFVSELIQKKCIILRAYYMQAALYFFESPDLFFPLEEYKILADFLLMMKSEHDCSIVISTDNLLFASLVGESFYHMISKKQGSAHEFNTLNSVLTIKQELVHLSRGDNVWAS